MAKHWRKIQGFTLVELLVVVLIIGILVAIALPNFIAANFKAKNAATRSNMETVQIAAEAYSTDSGGLYAIDGSAAGFGPYFPGGGMSPGTAMGTLPANPVSGTTCTISGGVVANVQATRALPPANFAGGAGNLSYDALNVNSTYGICGGDANGNAISTNGLTVVLSNQ